MDICIYCGVKSDGQPTCDCEERINCKEVGLPGHYQCGICEEHKRPRFECGCLKYRIN